MAERLRETASQTAGPYVHIGCLPRAAGLPENYLPPVGASPVSEAATGPRITLAGLIRDGDGAVVRDALVEFWQADAAGRYPGQPGADPGVTGFARRACDPESGLWSLDTVKPGPVSLPQGGVQAPHLSLWIVARGINVGLATRLYFPGDEHGTDPVLSALPAGRAATLVATEEEPGRFRFDIRLQGEGETVFLDL